MQIESGKYYKTRDGRVVGPMKKKHDHEWKWEDDNYLTYRDDGSWKIERLADSHDLIAPAYPETGTLQEIGARVGDVVEWDGHISHTVHDIQDGKYYISETNDQSGYKFWWSGSPRDKNWHIITRASEAKPSPVREVTRKEIVAGVYGKVVLHTHPDFACHTDVLRTAAELTAAIATLTEIRDAMDPA